MGRLEQKINSITSKDEIVKEFNKYYFETPLFLSTPLNPKQTTRITKLIRWALG